MKTRDVQIILWYGRPKECMDTLRIVKKIRLENYGKIF
jgi:hypothetical protein